MGKECAQSRRTLLLTGWLREFCENMINSIKGGRPALRKLGGVLSFSLHFHLVRLAICRFLTNSWVLLFFSY
jgi:hypothetical protein